MEPSEENCDFFPTWWSLDSFGDENQDLAINTSNPNHSSLLGLLTSPFVNPSFSSSPFNELFPFVNNGFTLPPPVLIDDSSNDQKVSCILPPINPYHQENYQEDYQEDHQENHQPSNVADAQDIPVFNTGSCSGSKGGKNKSKKIEGQPSKNLMAERRRRKRLNDRLSLLRSIVPKISKMDRTSILGDTIDYMKELLEKINHLKEKDNEEARNGIDQVNLLGGLINELTTNDGTMRNSPKFEVERRNRDTRIKIQCAAKPGLLSSTLNVFDALGLDIQQCVISCLSTDFSLQASCSEAEERRSMISTEEMKQVLFNNAGYGSRYI